MAASVAQQPVAANGAEAGPQLGGVAGPVPVHNSSLYVGDLDRDVSEAQLFELFSQIGPVASIRVCRDAVTRRSLGYAYVNYNSAVDPNAAERALEALNYTPLHGKPLRIMWSHRDPAARKSGVGNIFIKNLDKTIDNKALHDTFSAFGNILSCKVATDPKGDSKGYGFVHFEKDESAQLAIEKVNGMLLEGLQVYVGPFQKREIRPADGRVKFTNVYVKNLPESYDDEKFRQMFSEYGTVTSAVVMREADKSKGFGFVNFEDADEAAAAVEALNGKEFEGKELYVGRAMKKAEREAQLRQKFDEVRSERIAKYQGMNLYIKNLVDEVDDERLRSEFAPAGTITSAKVMRGPDGKSKGFGFVCYDNPEEATRAVTEMNGRMLMGKPMYVALAQRREVRKAQLEQQYTQRIPTMPARPGGPGGPAGPLPGMFPGGQPPMPGLYFPGTMGGRPGGPGGPSLQMYPGGMLAPARGMGPQGGRGPRGPAAAYPAYMGMAGPGAMAAAGGRGGRGRGPRGGGGGRFSNDFRQDFVPDFRGEAGPPMGFPGPPTGPRSGMPAGVGGRAGPPVMRGGPGGPGAAGGRGGRGMPAGVPPAPMAGVPPPPPAPQALASGAVPGSEGGLTTAMLAAAPPEQQKQMLGERLFPLVSGRQPELAGKITGMLLEMDNSELLLLLDSPEALDAKVDEAITVLKQHNALPDGVALPNGEA